MKNPANNHNRSLYLLAQFSIGSLTFARESWRGGNGGEGTGRSRCMFTLSGVFAKSCFIDGGLEGSSRTLDGEEAEAKNQACVLHYKFSPSPRYTPVYYSLRSPYLPRRIGYNNNNIFVPLFSPRVSIFREKFFLLSTKEKFWNSRAVTQVEMVD